MTAFFSDSASKMLKEQILVVCVCLCLCSGQMAYLSKCVNKAKCQEKITLIKTIHEQVGITKFIRGTCIIKDWTDPEEFELFQMARPFLNNSRFTVPQLTIWIVIIFSLKML